MARVDYYRAMHPDIRVGQALSNALFDVHVLLYERLRDEELDPFYDDNKVMLCILRAAELWDTCW
jgi:hypothetical protein